MAKPGLTGKGFYTSKLLFGGGLTDLTINAASCVNGITGYTNIYPEQAQDIIFRNLIINTTLLPAYYISIGIGGYNLFKIICRDSITINTGGIILADGIAINGNAVFNATGPCYGYSNVSNGTLGGSGNGGSATSTAGNPGSPSGTTLPQQVFYLGGAGGAGKTSGAYAGGYGGVTGIENILGVLTPQGQFALSNNYFQSSISNNAVVYGPDITGIFNTLTPVPQFVTFPYRISGGGGGGANAVSTQGGGCGGGVLYIASDRIVMNGGNISARGCPSYGGGGGGGVVIIVCNELLWPNSGSSISVSGGSSPGGASAGSDGTILIFSDSFIGAFTGTLTQSTYNTAVLAYQAQ